MTRIAVKQPDGQWAHWSTVIEDWILEDASREDIIGYELKREREDIDQWLDKVEDDDIGYRPSRSYEELAEKRGRRHGDESG